jgi:Polysaccharide deacetylase
MTACYLTIDTEYSIGFTRRSGLDSRKSNFDRNIACKTVLGSVGVEYQMNVLDAHRLKAVFFVDPMPALLWGTAAIEDVVGPIVARGHDVQLHVHTEWLELAGQQNPLGNRTGANVKNFCLEDQCTLLSYARDVLMAAGAPSPVAFRAGNYGANDDTLRALAQIGLRYDTSHSPGFAHSPCDIGLTPTDRAPVERCGIIEVPIGCIAGLGGRLRPAQLTALSAREMIGALQYCQQQAIEEFTLVSHSFELLSRDHQKINKIVKRRFELLCAELGQMPGMSTDTYATSPPQIHSRGGHVPILPFNVLRASLRFTEQAISNVLYGAK